MSRINTIRKFIPLEIIPRSAAWAIIQKNSRENLNTSREFLTGFINQKREVVMITIIVSLAFLLYSFFPWVTMRAEQPRFNSPDEAANYYFAARLSSGESMAAPEFLNTVAGGLIHPRATRVVNGMIVPASFIGLPVIYGILGLAFSNHIFPFITPFITALALLAIYGCWKRLLGASAAMVAVVLMAAHPAIWYYSSRGFYHNILFIDLFIFAWWGYWQFKESNYHLGWLVFSLLSLCLAIFVRASEALWVAPLAIAAVYAIRHKLNIRHLMMAGSVIVSAAMFWIWVSFRVYGQLLPPGYVTALTAASSPHYLTAIIARLINVLSPFGFSVNNIVINFFFYGLIVFWPYWVLVALGMVYDIRSGRKVIPRAYLLAASWITLWLAVYYGAWVIVDTVGVSSISVGSSYVRYWLPVYVVWLPYAAMIIIFVSRYLRTYFSRVWLIVILLLFGAMGLARVYFDEPEGLFFIGGRLRQYELSLNMAEKITPPAAVIIGDRADKVFFPERRVIVSDGRSVFDIPQVLEIMPSLAEIVPLYFNTVSAPNAESRRVLRGRRFVLTNPVYLPDDSWLYQLIHL